VRDELVAERKEALKTIVLFIPGFETPSQDAFVQRRVAPLYSLEPEERTRRRGRWELFGVTVHEMLHSVAHERYGTIADAELKLPDVFIEGGAEYFTLEIYDEVVQRAQGDEQLRQQIEGSAGPSFTPPVRRSLYEDHVAKLKAITKELGGNEENLRVAFFMGKVEYLGLGGWNQADALSRYEKRFPVWDLGVAIVSTLDSNTNLSRVRIGRVIYGRSGALQLNLGAGISYLSAGESLSAGEKRPGAGGDLAVRYQGDKLFLGAGVLLQGSYARGQGVLDSLRLDAIPRVEAGARLGRFRVAADVEAYVPLVGNVDNRTVDFLVGVGVSVAL
jgi:hypothetical protein